MKCKRIIALLLSVLILFSFAACSKVTPQEALTGVAADISNASALSISSELDLETENATEENEKEKITFLIDSKVNTKSIEGVINVNVKQGENIYDFIEIIFVNNKAIYINVEKIINLLSNKDITDALAASLATETELPEAMSTDKLESVSEEDEEIYNQYMPTADFDISAIATVLASLELPTYLSIPLDETDKDSGSISAQATVAIEEYAFVSDLIKNIYNEFVIDEEICTYDNKTETLSIVFNRETYKKLSHVVYNFMLSNEDNFYNVLLKIAPFLSEDATQEVYDALYTILTADLLEGSGEKGSYSSFVQDNEDKIKALSAENKITMASIIEDEVNNMLAEIKETVTVSIDTADKYVVTFNVVDENGKSKDYKFEVRTATEETSISIPKDAEGIETLLNGLLGIGPDISIDFEGDIETDFNVKS